MTKNNVDEPTEFEDAISNTGFGWYNIILLVVCGISLMSVIMETMSMSYIIPAAKCELELTLSDKGTLSSIGFLGVVLSSMLWGLIADTTGRKNVVLITSFISFLSGIASSLSPYVWLLILLRFLNCFFIGGPSAVVIAYLGEFHGLKYRAQIIALSATFVAVASILMPGLAWLVLPMKWSFPLPLIGIDFRPWRLLVILYGLPSFLSAIWLIFLPESPKFLWAIGKEKEALDVLRNIYAKNTRNSPDSYSVTKLALPNEIANDEKPPTANVKKLTIIPALTKLIRLQLLPIFRPPLVFRTFMTSLLQFGVFSGSSGFLMWLPEILNRVSIYSEQINDGSVEVCQAWSHRNISDDITDIESTDECTDTINEEVFKISLVAAAAFALTYILIGCLINFTGKKRLLVGLLAFSGTAGVVTHFMNKYLLIAIMSGLYMIGGAGVTILNTSVVDLFPTQYRSIAMAVSLMAGRTGAVVASHVIGYILEFACFTFFFILGGLYLLLALISLLLPTK